MGVNVGKKENKVIGTIGEWKGKGLFFYIARDPCILHLPSLL
jgi:hypothetical protein